MYIFAKTFDALIIARYVDVSPAKTFLQHPNGGTR